MDGLSAASSVIAVIQISSQIFDLCRTYYINVKDARKDIQRLRNEITALQDVLVNIADLADDPNSSSLKALNLISQEDGPVQQCQLELEGLVARLDPGEEKGRMRPFGMRALKWPFSSKEVDKILVTIGRHKSTFTLAITTDQTALSLTIAQGVADITQQLEAQRIDDDREAIIKWLSPTDPSTNYHAACKKCQPGSGRWVLERAEFTQWQATRNSLLWLHGIPGSGKTILSSTIIQELQAKCNVFTNNALVYFYFDFNTTAKQDPANCLASIIEQICSQIRTIPAYIRKSYERHSYGKQQASLDELKETLLAATENFEEVFIVLDALDECPKNGERESLLATISDILSQARDNLHILVTSRRERDIEEVLLPLLTNPAISIQGSGLELDIKMYISWQLATDPRLQKWSTDVKAEIRSSLVAGANGMFRWVDCQLDALKRCLKVTLIRDALKNLPKTLDDTYSRVFLSIDEVYRDDAKNALMWLAFAERPLQLRELAEATVIHPRSNPSFDPEERFPDPQDVLEILSSLVTCTEFISNADCGEYIDDIRLSVTVTLAHYSVQEYLISDRIKDSPASYLAISEIASDFHIGESCIKYLLYFASSTKKSSLPPDLKEFPLLQYAATYWHTHINLLPPHAEQEGLTLLALELLLSHLNSLSWSKVKSPNALYARAFNRFDFEEPSTEYALFCATELGLVHVVQELLDRGSDPNLRDDHGETLLHRVAKYGHGAVALALLNNGALVDATNRFEQTPFHWAAYCERYGMVDLLLEWGADINAMNINGHTALHFATSGSPRMLKYLLQKGASSDVRSQQ